MATKERPAKFDAEVTAMNAVVTAINELDAPAQQRVISYVVQRFNLQAPTMNTESGSSPNEYQREPDPPIDREEPRGESNPVDEDGLEGINPVARKWMSRNGLAVDGLSKLFSLGIDEIDLVAKKVPGNSKKERMRSVILMKGVASYLGGGAPRVSHEQVKETCLHYDAFDTDNFAQYLKKMSAEVGGTKEAGYTLTARGLTAATELVKQILHPATK